MNHAPVAAQFQTSPVRGSSLKFERVFNGLLTLLTLLSACTLTVNPWPVDGWFQTQFFLFGKYPGEDNYVPIAVPAVLYWLLHQLSFAMHLDLRRELYLGSIVQNCLACASAMLVYRTGRQFTSMWIAAVAALCVLLLVLSTGLPQAFWSENTMLFLISGLVHSVFRLERDNGSNFLGRSVICGLLIAASATTRILPLLFIPAGALAISKNVSVRHAVSFASVTTFIALVSIAAMMVANEIRFGRLEITNSFGRHLWQGARFCSEDGAFKMKNWWEIPPVTPGPGDTKSGGVDPREDLLKAKALAVIATYPACYLKTGFSHFITTIGNVPYRLGLIIAPEQWNPLHLIAPLPAITDAFLGMPPLVARAGNHFFYLAYRALEWLYPITIYATLIYACTVLWKAVFRTMRRDDCSYLFCFALFFGTLYLSWQVESPNTRNVLPYLSLWAVMLCIASDSLVKRHSRALRTSLWKNPSREIASNRMCESRSSRKRSGEPFRKRITRRTDPGLGHE